MTVHIDQPERCLFAFSGIDGSGKSTQAKLLADALADRGLPALTTHTKLHATRSIFRLAEDLTGDPYAYHPLIPATLREFAIAADVLEHSTTVIEPALADGLNVICDRSPLCYRSYAQAYEADLTWVLPLLALARQPDRIYLMDLDAESACARVRARTLKPAKSDETEPLLTSVRERYLDNAGDDPTVMVVDASDTPERIARRVLRDALAVIDRRQEARPTVSGRTASAER